MSKLALKTNSFGSVINAGRQALLHLKKVSSTYIVICLSVQYAMRLYLKMKKRK